MSLTDLSSLGSFVSGVAVVITLIFLVIQMRQNTLAVRAAASQALSTAYGELSNITVVNADMARIWRLGHDDIGQLNDDERVRFISYLSTAFRFIESARIQWQLGQLDKEHWLALESDFRDIAMQPGVKSYWALRSHWHTKSFRTWFESLPQSERPALFGTSSEKQLTNDGDRA
jgi:hypothetical protein